MKAFPKKIFVNWEIPVGGESYFEVSTNIKFLDESTDKVAIYELKEVKTLKVTRELK